MTNYRKEIGKRIEAALSSIETEKETDFIKYLISQGKEAEFKAQIYDLSDFIKDIDLFTHIEINKGEMASLKVYIEQCYLRLDSMKEMIEEFERK